MTRFHETKGLLPLLAKHDPTIKIIDSFGKKIAYLPANNDVFDAKTRFSTVEILPFIPQFRIVTKQQIRISKGQVVTVPLIPEIFSPIGIFLVSDLTCFQTFGKIRKLGVVPFAKNIDTERAGE